MKQLSRPAAGILTTAVCVGLLSLAPVAQANSPQLLDAPHTDDAAVQSSSGIAGFAVTAHKGLVQTASTSFVVPPLDCSHTGSDLQSIEAGIGVLDSPIPQPTIGGVLLNCFASTVPSYELHAVANGVSGALNSNVSAGDDVTVSYTITGSTLVVTSQDLTTGASTSASGPAPSNRSVIFGMFPSYGDSDEPMAAPVFGTVLFDPIALNRDKAATIFKDSTPIEGTGFRIKRYRLHNPDRTIIVIFW